MYIRHQLKLQQAVITTCIKFNLVLLSLIMLKFLLLVSYVLITLVLSQPVQYADTVDKLNDGLHAVTYALKQLSPHVSGPSISQVNMVNEYRKSIVSDPTIQALFNMLLKRICKEVINVFMIL